MDAEAIGASVQDLSVNDRRELQQAVEHMQQQNAINGIVQDLTAKCFSKCVTTAMKSDGLSSAESSCATNCVGRWIEVQTAVLRTAAGQR